MATPVEGAAPSAATPAGPGPVIIDLGKKSRKQIRRAREGTGKLIDEINVTLEELRAQGTIKPDAQPVLIIVRQKPRKKAFGWPLKI
jgi:hypothetical protein